MLDYKCTKTKKMKIKILLLKDPCSVMGDWKGKTFQGGNAGKTEWPQGSRVKSH